MAASFTCKLDRPARIQEHVTTGADQDVAAIPGIQGAGVGDPGGDQGDSTARGCRYITLVGNTGGAVALEPVITGHEVLGGNIQGRGDQPTHVDLGAGAE